MPELRRLLPALALAAALAPLDAAAQEDGAATPATDGPATEDPAAEDTGAEGPAAGPYLAARAAGRASDFAAAADLLPQALAGGPGDVQLLEGLAAADLALGRAGAAAEAADRMVAAGGVSPIAHMARAARDAAAGDWDALLADLDAGRGVSPLVDGLSRGWAEAATGDLAAARAAFEEVAARGGLRSFGLYHEALALAWSGDLEGAEAILARPEGEGVQRTRRVVVAHAQVLGALGRPEDALAVIDAVMGDDLDPGLADLRARLAGGAAVAFDAVAGPAQGLAEAYLNVAGAAAAEGDATAALMQARTALALDPGLAEAALLAAESLEELGRPEIARAALALVAPDDPTFVAAEVGRAASLRRSGEGEAAVEVLAALARRVPDRPEVQVELGDALRGVERLPEAEAAYSRAIDLYPEGAPPLWFVHYARAIVRERSDDWPGAEADLRRALALRPGDPRVLNYLGYTLLERGGDLDEALALIEEAVAAEPENGAIVDSLGWAFYRLGRYPEAVRELERAVTLEPTDPVLNDHLGDAYWQVGRTREARFQWTRALSFDPEEAESALIRTKLEGGLGAALAAEASPIAEGDAGLAEGAPDAAPAAPEGSGG